MVRVYSFDHSNSDMIYYMYRLYSYTLYPASAKPSFKPFNARSMSSL